MSKFIRIDMTLLETSSEDAGTEYDLSGGRGLIARLLNDEVDPLCGPLESGNLLVFCTGVLAGTAAPTSSRLSVGAKSPLTGGIKEANAGGTFGRRLADYNIKAIIIEGKPLDEMIYIIHISEAGVQVLPADDYRGLNNYELVGRLAGCFGTDISVASIGVAGERGYHNSTVQVTDMEGRPARAAARGGLGAVMGSKGIKAVVIDRPSERITPEYEDGSAFREACRNYIRGIKANPTSGMAMPALGTAVLVNPVNAIGALPVNNFSSGQFADAERISGEMLSQIQNKRGGSNGHGCQPGCPIRCSNVYMDESGSYLTSGFEFETIALNGSNLGISNLDVIAGIDRICDDLGIDTMETGCTMGVCMEAGLISFGDEDGVFSLLSEMADGTDRGRLLAMGAAECGKKLGVERVPAVKNQAMAAYDPRALKGTGVTYATSPMGADHTAGNTIGNPAVSPVEREGQVKLSTDLQLGMATFDSLGMCIFAGFCTDEPENLEYLVEMLRSRFGGEWDAARLFGIGAEAISLEKKFNAAAGFTPEDDRLPAFMYEEPLPPNNTVFDISAEELSGAIPF